ncbi:MAG TPA: PilN domain-containing protein [Salinisphaeraceae bacterium]|nr:PilN domain-containing protein [Salinisphaeraceae bacterium]
MNDLLRINLLDWREARREERRRNFLGALTLTALLCGCAIAFVTLFIFGQRLENQQQRNQYLQEQIKIVDQKMVELKEIKQERADLIQRMRTIENLQLSRSWIVHYLDQIVTTLPEGVFLKSLQQNGTSTTLKGVAESNSRVSEYMVNLDGSRYLGDPRLIVIERIGRDGQHYADFTLEVDHMHPDDDEPSTTQLAQGEQNGATR